MLFQVGETEGVASEQFAHVPHVFAFSCIDHVRVYFLWVVEDEAVVVVEDVTCGFKFHLLEYLGEVVFAEVEGDCEVLEDLEDVFRDEWDSEHGGVGDREEDEVFEKVEESFFVLYFF